MLIFKPLTRYFDFTGRATRKEFWLFSLALLAGWAVLLILDMQLGLAHEASGLLSLIFHYATLIPWLAVSVRRLHDSDRHGGWMFLWATPTIIVSDTLINHPSLYAGLYGIDWIDPARPLNPNAIYWWEVVFIAGAIASLIGFAWFLVLMCFKGTPTKNRFGSPDKPTNK